MIFYAIVKLLNFIHYYIHILISDNILNKIRIKETFQQL